MTRKMVLTAVAGTVGGVAVLSVAFGWWPGSEGAIGLPDCEPAYRGEAAFRSLLPDGWAVDTTAVVRMEGMVREFDDAPIDIVAVRVVDEDGEQATDEVTIWARGGGSQSEDFTNPKDTYALNDAAKEAFGARLEDADEETRENLRDLREQRPGMAPERITEDADEVRRARNCLTE